jgi:hypothetical protein
VAHTDSTVSAQVKPGLARRVSAYERRCEGYAIHFVLDCGMDGYAPAGAGPTDENLALNLRHCARVPRPGEYPDIRRHVAAFIAARNAQ